MAENTTPEPEQAATPQVTDEQVFEMIKLARSDRDAFMAQLADERQRDADYVAARPGTPLADALASFGIDTGAPKAQVTTTSGNGRGSSFDEAHAAEWLAEKHAGGHKGNKWPLIQAYRAAGFSAKDEAFFELVKAEWAS